MQLVGLYTYCKMMHDAYNVKLVLTWLNLRCVLYRETDFTSLYFEIFFQIFTADAAQRTVFWFISYLAESNRTSFDFTERESELVCGFNIEYGGGGFALIFFVEYASIIFIRLLFCIFFR